MLYKNMFCVIIGIMKQDTTTKKHVRPPWKSGLKIKPLFFTSAQLITGDEETEFIKEYPIDKLKIRDKNPRKVF